jgi:hypothetical protein
VDGNRVLRKTFEPRLGVTGGWRKLHEEELHNLCASPDIVRMMKLSRLRLARHVACMGDMRNTYI